MIGIYKITSPTNRIYIGQSHNIENRFNIYTKLKCKHQPRLYNSLYIYGFKNHIFEIIEECSIDKLSIRERYWQEYYEVITKNGLNCEYVKTDLKKGEMSKQTKLKISKALTGRKLSKSHVEKIKIALSKRVVSNNVKIKIGNLYRGKTLSKEHIEKMRKTKLSQNLKSSLRKKIKQFNKYNIFIKEFDCITNCANDLNLHRANIIKVLKGDRKTTGGFIFKYSAVRK